MIYIFDLLNYSGWISCRVIVESFFSFFFFNLVFTLLCVSEVFSVLIHFPPYSLFFQTLFLYILLLLLALNIGRRKRQRGLSCNIMYITRESRLLLLFFFACIKSVFPSQYIYICQICSLIICFIFVILN